MAIPGLLLAACLALPAGSDRVVAGDLAPVSAAFAELDPHAVIGWAPAPGVPRLFPAAELRRIAARLGSQAMPDSEVCVERRVAPPDPSRILAAMQSQWSEGAVTLLDFSRAPAPEGELVFPKSGLRRGSGALYWYGYVQYAAGRKFALWAKVRLPAKPVIIAATDLAAGRGIEPEQLRIEMRDDLASGLLSAAEDAIGKWPRRPIRAGTAIATAWLDPAPAVRRGDPVKVEVRSGGVHLEFDARAETTAGRGGRVTVRNPENQKRFSARVEGKGRVSAAPGAAERNP